MGKTKLKPKKILLSWAKNHLKNSVWKKCNLL